MKTTDLNKPVMTRLSKENVFIDQGFDPSCSVAATFNCLENWIRQFGEKITPEDYLNFWKKFSKTLKPGDGTNIFKLAEYTKENPLLEKYTLSIKTLFNSKVPKYRANGLGDFLSATFKYKSLLLGIRMQRGDMLIPTDKNGHVYYAEKGFLEGEYHMVCFMGKSHEVSAYYEAENSWADLESLKIHIDELLLLTEVLYAPIFKQIK